MIEFYNVHFSISNKQIIRDASLRILKGEFVYLTGISGAGKSSILRLIYMDDLPDSGMIVVEKYSTAKIKLSEIPYLRRKLGVIFQDFKLLKDRTVFENVAFAMRVTGAKSRDIKRRVMKVLAEVNLGHMRNQFPDQLSGGEQQRVAIARAIVNNPLIILADEPTGNLDYQNSRDIMEILERINRQGTAVLMATHNREILKEFPHRSLEVKEGRVIGL